MFFYIIYCKNYAKLQVYYYFIFYRYRVRFSESTVRDHFQVEILYHLKSFRSYRLSSWKP